MTLAAPDWPRAEAWSRAIAVERADAPLRAPVATYRLQFGQGFTFEDAARVVPYLAALGVTECYASPLLTAGPGSAHGYDICDHDHLNPELGDDRAQAAFFGALQDHGLGLLVDFVPNHMGTHPQRNRWWRDVLENGPSSPFADYFDIDWAPVKPELRDKILLPILGDQYGAVLERGELRLSFEEGLLELGYFDVRLPVNPRQAPCVYRYGLEALRAELGDRHANLRELMSILTALDHLPVYTDRDPERIVERQREKEVARERLARLVSMSGRIRAHIEAAVHRFNGTPGDPASFDLLHDLLEAQAYRLACWRTATDEINYRRFFDVHDLAGLRMEEDQVFRATHGLLLELVERGVVTGVRVDHPDGLYDPAAYFARLQAEAGARLMGAARTVEEGTAAGRPSRPLYVLAEKILSHGERLRDEWTIHGTTGYDYLNALNGLFVDAGGASAVRRVYQRFTGQRDLPGDLVYTCKRLIMQSAMSSELNVLAHAFNRLSESDRRSRDFTLNSLRRALMEVVACFPVYRTYVTAAGADGEDARTIDTAIAEARRRNPTMESSIFAFVRRILLGRADGVPVGPPPPAGDEPETPVAGGPGADARRRAVELARRVQQYTGPVQAKGVEDTAFYRDAGLVSINEVGGDLRFPACDPESFHEANTRRLARWPFAMLATATHDTKRGEDVRARVNVISEIPERWRHAVSAWARLNAGHRTLVNGSPAPDRHDEYLFYQTAAGAWPAERLADPVPATASEDLVRRLTACMLKAVREAKRHTSWISPNAAYEAAVERFVEATLRGPSAWRFLSLFVPFQRRLAFFGAVNSLAQVVIKVASPGVPDFYQGCELWDLNLVDPDNRRPVDFQHRAARLAELRPALHELERTLRGTGEPGPMVAALLESLRDAWPDERAKFWTTLGALRLRRALPQLFLLGAYHPLSAAGNSTHVVAFARERSNQVVIAVVPRFRAAVAWDAPALPIGRGTWGETRVVVPAALASRRFVDALTGARISVGRDGAGAWLEVGEALAVWPVALLIAH